MKKISTNIVLFFICFCFMVSRTDAQIIDETLSMNSLEELNWNKAHTFTLTNGASSMGAFHPMNATTFGIVCEYKTGGNVSPWNVNKDMLLKAQQYNMFWKCESSIIKILPSFSVYDRATSKFKEIGTPGSGGLLPSSVIFSWVISGRIWYCQLTSADFSSFTIGNEAFLEYVMDVYNNQYGMLYFDL